MIVMNCPPIFVFVRVRSQICHFIQEIIHFADRNTGMSTFGQALLENVLDDLKDSSRKRKENVSDNIVAHVLLPLQVKSRKTYKR